MIGIIHYDMGNITSVKNACDFIGVPAVIIRKPEELDRVDRIILPGVGAFRMGMEKLNKLGFEDAIKRKVAESYPLLGICLGMQLLASVGEEGGESLGLNLIKGRVLRFDLVELRVPHVGWNNVNISRENPLIKEESGLDFYFVHSYHMLLDDKEDEIVSCEYGKRFTAAVAHGSIFGTQFHPEKSFRSGLDILRRFSAV
mgnify:CR=1 FL=1